MLTINSGLICFQTISHLNDGAVCCWTVKLLSHSLTPLHKCFNVLNMNIDCVAAYKRYINFSLGCCFYQKVV